MKISSGGFLALISPLSPHRDNTRSSMHLEEAKAVSAEPVQQGTPSSLLVPAKFHPSDTPTYQVQRTGTVLVMGSGSPLVLVLSLQLAATPLVFPHWVTAEGLHDHRVCWVGFHIDQMALLKLCRVHKGPA